MSFHRPDQIGIESASPDLATDTALHSFTKSPTFTPSLTSASTFHGTGSLQHGADSWTSSDVPDVPPPSFPLPVLYNMLPTGPRLLSDPRTTSFIHASLPESHPSTATSAPPTASLSPSPALDQDVTAEGVGSAKITLLKDITVMPMIRPPRTILLNCHPCHRLRARPSAVRRVTYSTPGKRKTSVLIHCMATFGHPLAEWMYNIAFISAAQLILRPCYYLTPFYLQSMSQKNNADFRTSCVAPDFPCSLSPTVMLDTTIPIGTRFSCPELPRVDPIAPSLD